MASHANQPETQINPDFQPIVLTATDDGQFQVVAEVVEVFGGGA